MSILRRMISMGAGLAALTSEKIEETVQELVRKGELTQREGKAAIRGMIERSRMAGRKQLAEQIEALVRDSLQKRNLPSREEFEELKARLDRLEQRA